MLEPRSHSRNIHLLLDLFDHNLLHYQGHSDQHYIRSHLPVDHRSSRRRVRTYWWCRVRQWFRFRFRFRFGKLPRHPRQSIQRLPSRPDRHLDSFSRRHRHRRRIWKRTDGGLRIRSSPPTAKRPLLDLFRRSSFPSPQRIWLGAAVP